MCLADRPYLSLVCDTGPTTGLCLCKAGWSQGPGDSRDANGERCPGPQQDTQPSHRALPQHRRLMRDSCPGEAGPAGMLLPRAVERGGWCPRGGKKASEDAPRRGRASSIHRGCRRRAATVGAGLAARQLQDGCSPQSPHRSSPAFLCAGACSCLPAR